MESEKAGAGEPKVKSMAHTRRQKENETFAEIAQTLPTKEHTKDLDKASVLRVAINFMRLRNFISEGEPEPELPEEEEEELTGGTAADIPKEPSISDILPNFSKDVLQALDGFVMVFAADGRVLYTSETIAQYLGLRQVDVIGVNVADILHPQDCTELASVFQTQGRDTEQVYDTKDPYRRKFLVRMRCAFTPSIRSITRCSNFKPVYCSCYLKFAQSGPRKGQFIGLVALCKLANTSKIREMVVGTFFKTKHGLDLSYKSLDRRIYWILGYDPSEMVGLRAYQYFHPEDLTATSSCHMNLLSRGESHSPCYRILSRWGDWMWVRSKSYMVYNQRNQLPEGIVIYTWIVRVDEEDERMLAIKNGDSGEGKLKKYDPFSSQVSSVDGTLDVSALIGMEAEEKATPTPAPPEPLVLPPNPIKRDVSPPCGVNTPPDSAPCDLSLSQFTLPSPPNSHSSYCGSPETQGQVNGGSPDCHMTQGGSPDCHMTQGPLVGDLNEPAYGQSYKMSPPYTPYVETSTTYSSPPMAPPVTDTPTFQYKLEHSSPDASLEGVSLAYSTYTTDYSSYQDVGVAKMTPHPPSSFDVTSQDCSTMMYAGEQPIGFETTAHASGVKQTIVTDARRRYGGSMPTSRYGNDETEQISQWSQWLKGAAPPPVF